MNFLNPLMLAGMAAVSVPVILHLLNKFRVRTTDWGAMRFLLESVQKNQRKKKMEDLLLLLLRCLLVALAVLAFARPALTALVKGGAGDDEAVAAVVLLDHSASMSQSAGATSLFDQAKEEIRVWLDRQPPETVAALALFSNRTESLIPAPSPDRGAFRRALSEAETTDRGTDVEQAVRVAIENLKGISGKPREIRIYTDGQAGGWSKRAEILKLAEENPGIRIRPVLVGESVPENLGITGLRAEGGVVAVRQPAKFRIEVGNFGEAVAERVKVSLSIDGGAVVGSSTVDRIEPGSTQAVDVVVAFPEAGPQALVASLGPDAFAADNLRALAIDVVNQMHVLVAEDEPSRPAAEREGFFVANALVPLSADRAAQHFLAAIPTAVSEIPAELANPNNTAPHVIVLCDPETVSPAVGESLQTYVRSGGNLIVFPGMRTDPKEWEKSAAFQEILPATLGPATEDGEGVAPQSWQSSAFAHPVTALWNDSTQGSLGAIQVFRHFPLAVKGSGSPKVIAQLANGEAAVVEWRVGDGTVVLFNSTATPEWSNLPLHPAFVPLMQRLMGYLNRASESRLVLAPGEAFRRPVEDRWRGASFSVKRPGSDLSRASGQVSADDSRTFVRYAATDRAGVYRVSAGDELLSIFSVQMDGAESDLRRVGPEVLAEISEARAAASEGEEMRPVVTREFWTPLLWVVAAVFLFEAFMAHRISHDRSV